MNPYKIIDDFIKKKKYQERKDIVMIIFYGSSKYGTNTSKSDVDLLVVTVSYDNYKGVTYIDGVKIEYFEKTVDYITQKLEEQSNNTSLKSIINNGEVVYGDKYFIEYFKSIIPENKKSKLKDKGSYTLDYYEKYKNSINEDYKKYFYYLTLEQIRLRYQFENKYGYVTGQKANKLYRNRAYAKKYYNLQLPDENFCDEYLEARDNPDEQKLNEMISKINLKRKEEERKNFNYSIHYCKEYSTTVSNFIEEILDENNNVNISNYYLALDKIRILYCMKVGTNTSIKYFLEECEDEFIKLFDKCIKEKSYPNIVILFEFVTKSYNIDYKEYVLKDYN